MLNADRIRTVLSYDPATGFFTWIAKASRKVVIGTQAGGRNTAGYVVIGIDGRIYYAHRLAWIWMTGTEAPQIDHADGDRGNNRWDNLRPATHQQNIFNARRPKNNSSGFKGVSWHARAGKWAAHFNVNGKKHHLGLFDEALDAHRAYINAVSSIQPDFVRAS